MSLNFPSSPALDQEYTLGAKTWVWNGTGWALKQNNAAVLLDILKTVDGTDSGLDAELLAGNSASYYTNIPERLGYTPENIANKNIANGYAGLESNGLISSALLPSYVDDVLEYANLASMPAAGESGKIYVALDTNKTYRWSGSAYIYITSGAVDSVNAGNAITVSATTGVITVNHADTSNVANLSSDNSGNTFIQDISFTFDTYGHVTAATVATGTASFTNSNDFGTFAINGTDSGYTWGTANTNTNQVADAVGDTLTFVKGGGINLYANTVAGTDAIKIEHADTSSATNLTAASRTYVTGLTFDGYGHVTGYTTGSESVTDTNTTYSLDGSGTTNSANIELIAGGSGSGTDSINVVGSGATTVSWDETNQRITISSTDTNTTYSKATSTALGLVEVFSDTVQTTAANAVTTTASRTYGVQFNSADQLVVNVPWTDTNTNTTYSLDGSGTTNSVNIELIAGGSGSGTDSINVVGSGATTVAWDEANQRITISSTDTNTTYSKATSTTLGLVEVFSDTVQSTAANAVTTTANRTYGVQFNSANQLVVNVPWTDTDTNTTYSAGTDLSLSGTTFNHVNSGVTAGTYNNVTVNARGHVTSGSNVAYLTSYTETDTLASVTARGNVSTSSIAVPSGENVAYGLWGGTSTYSIAMGVTAGTYQYGPVTDYSIKMSMGGGAGRGFTWGQYGSKPIAALNSTTGDMTIAGTFSASAKSFLIPHPTKPDKKLRHGSLEGPEHGVYVRGKIKGNVIELPEYWTKLVDPDSITVQLTPIGKHQKLYVEDIRDNKVYIANDGFFAGEINCFYYILAERCDVDKLDVEIY